MKNFIHTLKIFLRIPGMTISYLLMVGADNFLMYKLLNSFLEVQKKKEAADMMYYYGDMGILCFFLSIFSMFMGCEFLRRNRESCFDQIALSGKSINIVKVNQIGVLGGLLFVHLINIGIYFLFGTIQLGTESLLMREVWTMFFTDYFLLVYSALAIGILLAQIKNRYLGYGLILLNCLISLPATSDILTSLYHMTQFPFYLIQDFLCAVPPDFTATYDPLYGFPMESYRVFTKLFWIALAVWIEIYHITKRNRRKNIVVSVVGAAVTVLIIVGVVDRGSVLRMGNYAMAGMEDTSHYYSVKQQKEQKENFAVESYDMDMVFGKQLDAVVKMELKQNERQEQYRFTLYHGYRIQSIHDESGKNMKYERDGDYVTVINRDKDPIRQMTFVYRGFSNVFYSNQKACFLPGIFPYYPKAGFMKIYEDGYVASEEEISHFKIKTKGMEPFSNLEKKGQYLEGDSENVTLLYGYYDVIEKDHQRFVYYPLNGLSREMVCQWQTGEWETKTQYEKLCDYLDIPDQELFDQKDFIAIPSSLMFNSVVKPLYLCDSYLLVNSSGVDEYAVLDALLPQDEKKEYLRKEFFYLRPGEQSDFSEETLYSDEVLSDEYERSMEIHDLFIEKARKLGIKEVSHKVVQYLMDSDNTEDEIDFLRKL